MGEQDRPGLGDSVYSRMGGEGAAQRATDDEDVEGHAAGRGAERGAERAAGRAVERAAERGAPGDDDVEGHKFQP